MKNSMHYQKVYNLFSILNLRFFTAFIFTLANLAHAEAPHKIIYFISTPRSLSTVFTRMIYGMGTFEIFHEPSQPIYNAKTWHAITHKTIYT